MYKLGIDIGSTTIKMALIKVESQKSKDRPSDSKPVVLATDYRRHNAEPMKVGQEMIEGILKAVSDQHSAISVGITGSVGMGCAQRLGIGFHQEVIAAAEVVKQLYPDVHCLVDIGGEDSKMIFFEEGCVPEMRMNGNCAGGTGAFIDQTATLLGVETSELNALAAMAVEDFSCIYTELQAGYDFPSNQWMMGAQFAYIPGHFGFGTSFMVGFDGGWDVTGGPVFRLTTDATVFDLQVYQGFGYGGYYYKGFIAETSLRFAFGRRLPYWGLWSFNIGCLYGPEAKAITFGVSLPIVSIIGTSGLGTIFYVL